jgi:hypothetical protein
MVKTSTNTMKTNFLKSLVLLVGLLGLLSTREVAANDNSKTWEVVGAAGISSGAVTNTKTAITSDGTLYVAYKEAAPGQSPNDGGKATVKKFNGSAWEAVGAERFSAGDLEFLSFAIDGNGTPYLSYQDKGNGGKATVMKFNGKNWVSVASAGFTENQVSVTSLAFDSDNTPYLAMVDNADFFSNIKVSVLKFNGTAWEAVGPMRFSAGSAHSLSLAIDANDIPFVAYQDNGNGGKATVMKFNGNNWVSVGPVGFSADDIEGIDLALSKDGSPYVAYHDNGNEDKATVMKFNGTGWEAVGSAGFTAGRASDISLAIDGSGVPFVAYVDWSEIGRATVMKYNGNDWEVVGNKGFSWILATYTSLALDGDGKAYVAYVDTQSERKATVMKFMYSEPNAAPTAIILSNLSLDENVAANSVVGSFITTDADADDTHTYSLVSGEGDTDNEAFTIEDDVLKIKASPDFETQSSYSIRVRADDGRANGSYEAIFTIQIKEVEKVVTGIAEKEDTMLRLYPNPTSSYLVVSFDKVIDTIALVNSNGSIVLREEGRFLQSRLDTNSLAPGIYIAMIHAQGKVYTRQIVITK